MARFAYSIIVFVAGVALFALGAYLAYVLVPYIGFWGALLVSPLLTALIGVVFERVDVR